MDDFTTLISLSALICSIIGIVVASARERSLVGGFLLGAILGPLGVAILLLMLPDYRILEARAVQKGEARKCDKCTEIISIDAVRCRYCGSDVALAGPAAEA